MPERLAGGGVEGDEVAFGVAGEQQASGGGEHAGPGGRGVREFPFHFAGRGIERAQCAEVRLGFVGRKIGAAVIGVSGFVRLRRGAESVALVARGDIEQSGLRVVGGRIEIRGAQRSGTNGMARERRAGFLFSDGTAFRVFGVAPGLLTVGVGGDEFAGGAIQHIEETVAVGLQNEVLAAGIHEDGDLGCVPVVLVVFGELKIPVELAGIGIQGEQRVAVEVVTGAAFAAIGRGRIAGGPEDLVGSGVVGAGVPCRRAADFPGVCFPGIVAGLAGTGDGVEAPAALAGGGIVSVNEAADAVFAAGDSDQDEVFDDERSDGEAVAKFIVGCGLVPEDAAGFAVEGDDVGIEGAEEEAVAKDGEAA